MARGPICPTCKHGQMAPHCRGLYALNARCTWWVHAPCGTTLDEATGRTTRYLKEDTA